MITSFILTILKDLLDFVLSPFLRQPDAVLDPNISTSFTEVMKFLSLIGPVIPLLTIFAIMSALTFLELAMLFFKGLMFTIKKIPGIS